MEVFEIKENIMSDRNFSVYLLDGTTSSTIKYSAKNLSILGYNVQRSNLDSCKGIAAMKQSSSWSNRYTSSSIFTLTQ